MRKRPPAYAKELVQARKFGLVPEKFGFGHVCLALGWNEKRSGGLPRLVVPDDMPVDEVDLTCLAGLEVLLTYSSEKADRAVEVSAALSEAKAAAVTSVNMTLFDESVEAAEKGENKMFFLAFDRAVSWP